MRIILRKIKQLWLRMFPTKPPIRLSNEIGLKIDDEALIAIQRLMDRTEDRNFIAMLRKSLAMYDILTDHVADGGKVILKYADGTTRIFDPISFAEETDEES